MLGLKLIQSCKKKGHRRRSVCNTISGKDINSANLSVVYLLLFTVGNLEFNKFSNKVICRALGGNAEHVKDLPLYLLFLCPFR